MVSLYAWCACLFVWACLSLLFIVFINLCAGFCLVSVGINLNLKLKYWLRDDYSRPVFGSIIQLCCHSMGKNPYLNFCKGSVFVALFNSRNCSVYRDYDQYLSNHFIMVWNSTSFSCFPGFHHQSHSSLIRFHQYVSQILTMRKVCLLGHSVMQLVICFHIIKCEMSFVFQFHQCKIYLSLVQVGDVVLHQMICIKYIWNWWTKVYVMSS